MRAAQACKIAVRELVQLNAFWFYCHCDVSNGCSPIDVAFKSAFTEQGGKILFLILYLRLGIYDPES